MLSISPSLIERAALYDIVFFDMDGVLSDFDAGIMKLYDMPDGYDEVMWREAKPAGRTASQQYCFENKISKDDFWKKIHSAGADFWAKLPPLHEGVQLWNELQGRCQTVILTSPRYEPTAAAGKMMWLKRHLGVADEGDKRFVVTSLKHLLAMPGRLLIDDTEEKVEMFRAKGGDAWLWPDEAASICHLPRIRRV